MFCLINHHGNPKEWYDFGVFGNEKKGEDSLNPWRFAGKRKIGHLIYFGKRFYHPSLGRWLTPDPAGFEDGPNLYAYVHNNPLTHFDLLGLFDLDVRGKSYNECSNALDYHFQERFSEDHVGSAFMWGTVHYLAEICYNTSIFAFINPMQFSCPEFCKEQEESYQTGRYFAQGINYAAAIGSCAYSLAPAIANGASRVIGGMGKNLRFANFSKHSLKTLEIEAKIIQNEVPTACSSVTKEGLEKLGQKSHDIPTMLQKHLGNDSRAFYNNFGDLIIESKDGMKQFRIDLNHPFPHKNPHSHLIEYGVQKGKKFELFNERIYPRDVYPE